MTEETRQLIRREAALGRTVPELVALLEKLRWSTRNPITATALLAHLTNSRFPQANVLTCINERYPASDGILSVALGDAISRLNTRLDIDTTDPAVGATFAGLVSIIRNAGGIITAEEEDAVLALGGGYRYTVLTEAEVQAELDAVARELEADALRRKLADAHNAGMALIDSGERDTTVIAVAVAKALTGVVGHGDV